LFSFEANSNNLQKDFEKLRKNNFSKNFVLENNHFYFSQISFKWNKNSNRKQLSRLGTIQSIKQFKKKYTLKKSEANKFKNNSYLSNKISIKNTKKIEDRKYKNNYIVVIAIPKKDIQFNAEVYQPKSK
tara:strand:- start:7 stop:393 length:387 start_codon:yes stop_codon:yes gene_type:complete